MMDKKEFLLNSIIKAYIEHLEPIGSGQLKAMYNISFSPATIRGYFKKLGEEGYLAQEHASSGRTPTINALKSYWANKLDISPIDLDYNKLDSFAKQVGISVFLKQEQPEYLTKVLNIENLYLLLGFSSFSITISFNSALYKFLNDMLGLDINSIIDVSRQVGANELYDELQKYLYNKDFEIINIKEFLKLSIEYDLDEDDINRFLNGTIMDNLDAGIYFHSQNGVNSIIPQDYLGIVHKVSINNDNYKMFVLGQLSRDYEYFYKGVVA